MWRGGRSDHVSATRGSVPSSLLTIQCWVKNNEEDLGITDVKLWNEPLANLYDHICEFLEFLFYNIFLLCKKKIGDLEEYEQVLLGSSSSAGSRPLLLIGCSQQLVLVLPLEVTDSSPYLPEAPPTSLK